MLYLDAAAGRLCDARGFEFDLRKRTWSAAPTTPRGNVVSLPDAVRWVQHASGSAWRAPVGLIGPRAATPRQLELAEEVGGGLARLGLTLLCGGKQGVMEAACRGAAEYNGISIGLLPDPTWQAANPYVTVPIATGIGVARNAIIAQACFCLVAIGGGYGTLSEIAFGLQFGKPVFALEQSQPVHGVVEIRDWPTLENVLCHLVLRLN